jgi:hypothetical protein
LGSDEHGENKIPGANSIRCSDEPFPSLVPCFPRQNGSEGGMTGSPRILTLSSQAARLLARQVASSRAFEKIGQRLSRVATKGLSGEPDEVLPPLRTEDEESQADWNHDWYILSQSKERGSDNKTRRVAVAIRLDSLGRFLKLIS